MSEWITSRHNSRITQVRRLLSDRKERDKSGLFVSDGTKLLEEALHYGSVQTVFLTENVDLKIPCGVEVLRVSEDIMSYISPMESPQGALFICKKPGKGAFSPQKGMLLLDGIQDPGNVGTILRTADALDIPVALLDGCADPYSHKVVRASMGAVFRVCPVCVSWQEAKEKCLAAGISIAVTALTDRAVDIRSADLGQMAVVIGSEGRGVRPEVLEYAEHKLIIPMNPHCESLNAAIAAAIVMWQIKR